MYKDFTLKCLSLLLVGTLTSCGTANVLSSVLKPEANVASVPESGSILQHVTLANSRDVLVRVQDPQTLSQLPAELKLSSMQALSAESGLYRLQIPVGQSLTQTLTRLNQVPGVSYAEANVSFKLPEFQIQQTPTEVQPNDPNYGLQWNMRSSRVNQAWSLTNQNKSLRVAVIDSGVDPNHPDLVDQLETLEDIYNEQHGSDIFRHPLTGDRINFGGRDGNGHGTHVIGVIAATSNNQTGVAGVVGGGIRIIPIKATDYAGNTDAATLTAAFQRAIDRNAQVINISIGGPAAKGTRALTDVIQLALQKNISIVSATGNESDRSQGLISPITVPAAYAGVIAVGAHTEFDKVASYSNGGQEIDILAPGGAGRSKALEEGQQIWSTWPSYHTFEYFQRRVTSTYYAATSGTSMACPHVTGVVALMLSQEPHLTPAQIRSRLIATADDLGVAGFDPESGYGKLNAYRALRWTSHDARD